MIFTILNRDKHTHARCGLIKTRHGDIETPIFMPVGTAGAVKALIPSQLHEIGAQVILGNTYHLYLRPGLEVIEKFRSLHSFIGWNKPILTDSGGFQIFSIKENFAVSEEGVQFKSHLDGSIFFLTPEHVVDIQNKYDSDIQMVLDYFAGHPATREEDEQALATTHQWARRARQHFLETGSPNSQFAIIQGGLHTDLRQQSLEELSSIGFDGYAVGGLSVGEPGEEFERIIRFICPRMPQDKPHYLMGSGTPVEILLAVEHGIDMFDCVMPTRNARNGCLFTSRGKLSIKNERFKFDEAPPDPDCQCYTCRNFSRAYLRHLYISKEINASILNSIHNIYFYLDFMSKIRYSIKLEKFNEYKNKFLLSYQKGV
ncbi:MAG TPA: tRNA guanosine(34) transglycosylase Tgt [Candidatus Deferrimicrobium sp.]|nr:tRNA guanosine(34) transglycosylase Tgt [Candidatus Deferrimicrobium sp.]